MDNRCPLCGKDLGRRKLGYSIIARMDVDCPYCAGGLSVNLHRAERGVVLGGVAAAVLLAVLSLTLQSRPLLLAALGVGVAGALAAYLLERVWLRAWPRYVARRPPAGME